MGSKMQITVRIKNEDGTEIIESSCEHDLPNIKEIETEGFRPSINKIDKSFLEARKEATEAAVTEYLEEISKKKRTNKLYGTPTAK